MSWFKRQKAGINTKRSDQIDVPKGQWAKCPETGEIINYRVLEENALVFPGLGPSYANELQAIFCAHIR